MTSCNDDQWTGLQLEGSWQGKMFSNGGNTSITTFKFTSDPFRTTKGSGYWVDVYSHLNYIADRINWKVKDDVIYIYSMRERFEYTIKDYTIRNDHFVGYISDGKNESYFEMVKVDDSWMDEYNWDTGYSKKNPITEE